MRLLTIFAQSWTITQKMSSILYKTVETQKTVYTIELFFYVSTKL